MSTPPHDHWAADLPLLDDDGVRMVLNILVQVLTYRPVTQDDVRQAYSMAQHLSHEEFQALIDAL